MFFMFFFLLAFFKKLASLSIPDGDRNLGKNFFCRLCDYPTCSLIKFEVS